MFAYCKPRFLEDGAVRLFEEGKPSGNMGGPLDV